VGRLLSGQQQSRKRGVRASRAKLYRALTDAGLKTQAALAERIADLEDLESPPKDTISRVFRELPVETQTLERVARALGVEGYQLYLTSEDTLTDRDSAASAASAPDEGPNSSVVRAGRSRLIPRLLVYAVLPLAVLATAILWLSGSKADLEGSRAHPQFAAGSILGLGRPTLAVLPIDGDSKGRLTNLLRQRLQDEFNVAAQSATVLTQALTPETASARLRTDHTIFGEMLQIGRLTALRLYTYSDGARRQIWAESFPTVMPEQQWPALADRAHEAVQLATGLTAAPAAAVAFPPADAQDDFLAGAQYLDEPSSEINVKRAQTRFESALRKDPYYARAQGGLCEALLQEHWMSDEQRVLEDASAVCSRGVEIDPDDPVVAAAHAHFLRRTGRNAQALELYERILAHHPWDSWALSGFASSLLHAYRQSGDDTLLEQAIEAARTAAAIDPYTWKPAFFLAGLEWFAGDVQGAISASEQALDRHENEFVLANLGTFYLCDGEFTKARDTYQRARELAPESYVGDEFLGQAYYYLGDFQRSAELRRKAIERFADESPEIHEMWGNLGDSLRLAGDRAGAVAAYLGAAEILERDNLRGNAPLADQAHRAYYYTMVRLLDPDQVPESVQLDVTAQLDEVEDTLAEPTARLRAAQTWRHLGETDRARAALAMASQTCRGYARHPDLAGLQP
jgi:tetratricopeptide (TPR) repeat protein